MLGEHLLDRDVLHSEVSALLLGALHGALEHVSGVHELERVDWRQDVLVLEMRVQWALLGVLVLDLGVDTVLRLIVDPLTNEELVLIVVEV